MIPDGAGHDRTGVTLLTSTKPGHWTSWPGCCASYAGGRRWQVALSILGEFDHPLAEQVRVRPS